MVQHNAAYWVSFVFGAVGASLVVGALLGFVPFMLARVVEQPGLGRVGFLATFAAGFGGGILLAVPCMLVFVVVILVRWQRARGKPAGPDNDAA